MDYNKIVGENIRNLKKQKAIQAKVLAIELGITASALCQMEQGKVEIRVSTIFKISEVLDIEPAQLIYHPVIRKKSHANNDLQKTRNDTQPAILVNMNRKMKNSK